MPKVVIIGGGISGLTTAWWLHKAGCDVLVLEKDSQVGGTMQTIHDNGWLVEIGPNSALETTPLFQTLFDDLGLQDEVVYANEVSNKRYIVRNGQLHALPMTPGQFLKSRLWSLAGKFRLFKEPFIGRSEQEETVAQFVIRRLGQEILDYAINPFVAGVFAGNPEELSVQAAFPKLYALEKKYGSLIKGQVFGARERKRRAEKAKDRARMFSFREGMDTLPRRIAQALHGRVKTFVTVTNITTQISSNGARSPYEIHYTEHGQPMSITAHAVIMAIPSFQAATLMKPYNASVAEFLNTIYYPPVAQVFLGHRREDAARPLDGFGFLVPAKEQRAILGMIWSSTIFPGRSPAGTVACTTFVGGSRQPELVDKTDVELLDIVRREATELIQLKGTPLYSRVTRWAKAIPQYRLGHLSVVKELEQFEQSNPGLYLSGNFRGGISVGDCIKSSREVADKALKFLETPDLVLSHVG